MKCSCPILKRTNERTDEKRKKILLAHARVIMYPTRKAVTCVKHINTELHEWYTWGPDGWGLSQSWIFEPPLFQSLDLIFVNASFNKICLILLPMQHIFLLHSFQQLSAWTELSFQNWKSGQVYGIRWTTSEHFRRIYYGKLLLSPLSYNFHESVRPMRCERYRESFCERHSDVVYIRMQISNNRWRMANCYFASNYFLTLLTWSVTNSLMKDFENLWLWLWNFELHDKEAIPRRFCCIKLISVLVFYLKSILGRADINASTKPVWILFGSEIRSNIINFVLFSPPVIK